MDKRLSELQQELMNVVRLNAKTGADVSQYDNEYAKLAEEIEEFRAKRQALLDKEAEDFMRSERIEELRDFLNSQESPLKRFDGYLFRRLIEKVRVKSLVEVTFVFKTGDEVREILG